MCNDAIKWLIENSLAYYYEKRCKNKKEFIRNICNEIKNVDIQSILRFLNLHVNIKFEDERDLSEKVEEIFEKSLNKMKEMVAAPYRNRLDYHCQEAKAMLATYRNFEKLIGRNHHNQTDGYHCEVLLKTYLRKHLCKRYSIDTGFICTNPSLNDFEDEEYIERLIRKEQFVQASKQIDILIHDIIDYENIYSIEDCVCVMPKSVNAIIEVKKSINKKQLNSALENINRNGKIILGHKKLDNVFLGIFAYDVDYGKLVDRDLIDELRKQDVLPNAICILNEGVIMIDNNKMKLKYAHNAKGGMYALPIFMDIFKRTLEMPSSDVAREYPYYIDLVMNSKKIHFDPIMDINA